MTSLLDETDLIVKRRPMLMGKRVGYDVLDQHGRVLGWVAQAGRDNLEKLLRPRRSDNARTSFELTEHSGLVVLRLTHIQAARSSLVVELPNGAEVGRIRLENIFGKSRFALEVAGTGVGAMTAETWRKKNFVVVDGQAAEFARIEMTSGSSGDHSHSNDYTVQINRRLEDPLRSLAVAAVIAVDMILWNR